MTVSSDIGLTFRSKVLRWRRVSTWIRGQCFLDLNGDAGRSVLLLGSGRSGTSWLAEALCEGGTFRYLFEPLHPKRRLRKIDAPDLGYVSQHECPDARAIPYIRAVMAGDVRDLWVDRYNQSMKVERRLIKEVRANLYLPWLASEFPETKILFVMRNPYLVADSQLKGFRRYGNWAPCLRMIIANPAIASKIPAPLLAIVDEAQTRSDFCQIFARWTVENYLGSSLSTSPNFMLLDYEAVRQDPQRWLARIETYLSVRLSEGAVASMERPSAMTRIGDDPQKSNDKLAAIKRALTGDETRLIERMLAAAFLERFL